MNDASRSLKQLRKATRLINRTFHKNGPKSYKRGQGALLKALYKHDGSMTSLELVDFLGFDRKYLKDVVRKAEKGGYATIEDVKGERAYKVTLTDAGEEVAEKRCASQEQTATSILAGLSPEEVQQLDAITGKLILRCKELGAHGARKHGKKSRRHGHKHSKKQ